LDTKLLNTYVDHYEFSPKAVSPDGFKLRIWREGEQLIARAVIHHETHCLDSRAKKSSVTAYALPSMRRLLKGGIPLMEYTTD
jgi:hypothetical protein